MFVLEKAIKAWRKELAKDQALEDTYLAELEAVLRRMEKEGLIRSQWRVSDENRMRKYYRLTDLGRREFEKEKARWTDIQKALRKIWATAAAVD